VINNRTAGGNVLKELSDGGIADLHVAINARFTLNPSQEPNFANFTQLEWVRARVLNVGFAHRPWKRRNGIRLSKMIVASSHSESGCHEDSIFVLRQVCQFDVLGSVMF
jgi:hypothetical protein